jgi:hypothetical protein
MEIVSHHNHELRENIIKDINKVNPNLVIDVGCGSYWSKSRIQNVVGFDQINPKKIARRDGKQDHKHMFFKFSEPDYICSIKEAKFEPECADVVMCLGSMNLSLDEFSFNRRWTNVDILSDFNIVYKWSRKYIVMRTRWELDFIEEVANLYNLKLVGEIKKFKTKHENQLNYKEKYSYYWWWMKK